MEKKKGVYIFTKFIVCLIISLGSSSVAFVVALVLDSLSIPGVSSEINLLIARSVESIVGGAVLIFGLFSVAKKLKLYEMPQKTFIFLESAAYMILTVFSSILFAAIPDVIISKASVLLMPSSIAFAPLSFSSLPDAAAAVISGVVQAILYVLMLYVAFKKNVRRGE